MTFFLLGMLTEICLRWKQNETVMMLSDRPIIFMLFHFTIKLYWLDLMAGTSLAPNSTSFLSLKSPTTGVAATEQLMVPASFANSETPHSLPMAK